MKKALLTRFGGIGDCAPMGVVGAELKKRGWEVTMGLRKSPGSQLTDLYRGNPCFDHLLDIEEVGPWKNRCVKTQLGKCSINSIYPDFDMVLDYMNIIEGNSTSPHREDGPKNVWQASRNSNWVNWYDLHLAWANIDPRSVKNELKRPKYIVTEAEKKGLMTLKKAYSHFITIQVSASSISRTWFQGKRLPEMILEKYPKALVAYWEGSINSWVLLSSKGATRLEADGGSPIRASMSLIAVSDAFIGADTGFSHVAEGLDVPNIAVYSTVPAWTRNQYYKFQRSIDPGEKNPEFYTFNLGLGDPLRVIEGMESLTNREKEIDKLYKKRASATEAAEALNTDEEGATLELESFLRKTASFERQQSKALSTVKPEAVFKVLEGALK